MYDYQNRLIEVQNSDGKVLLQYHYDPLGRRISKLSGNKLTTFTYAGNQALEEEILSAKTLLLLERRENFYSNNLDDILSTDRTLYKTVKTIQEYTDSKGRLRKRTVSKREGTTQRYFYEKNHLGSIVKITDSLGRAIEEYTYDVYGKAYINRDLYDKVRRGDLGEAVLESQDLEDEGVNEIQTNSEENLLIENKVWIQYNGRGIINNTRLYTGREYDRETGLYYLRARYYSADLGRFVSRDPIGIADDLNLYAYVGNSPVMFVDLSGLTKQVTFLSTSLYIKGLDRKFQNYINSNVVDLNTFPYSDLNIILNEADSFQIRRMQPFNSGDEIFLYPRLHTEIIFYDSGMPIASLSNVPFVGWNYQYQNNDAWDKAVSGSPIGEIKYDVTGCINGLTNSRLNTIFGLSGRTGICWESAINCYLGADY